MIKAKHIRLWVGLACLIAAYLGTGCSPYSIYTDRVPKTNFKSYTTYAWLPSIDSVTSAKVNRRNVEKMVHEETDAQMWKRGFDRDTLKPGLLLRTHLMMENKTEYINQPEYHYMPTANVGFYGGPYGYYPGAYAGTTTIVTYQLQRVDYKEGTLILDFIDHTSDKVVLRIWAKRRIDDGEKLDVEKEISRLVPRMFDEFPRNPVRKASK